LYIYTLTFLFETEKLLIYKDQTITQKSVQHIVEDPWKGVKGCTLNMKKLAPLMKVTTKITMKRVHKIAMELIKCDLLVWDALPWDGTEKKLQDLPIHPNLSRMRMELFDRVKHTPLQKLTFEVEVNCGSSAVGKKKQLSKKELVDQLDGSIVKIDNERVCIECFKEACSDMANDMRQISRSKGTKIPERFITKLEQLARDSNAIDTSISARLSMLQDICFGFVPEPAHKESPPRPVVKQTPYKRNRGAK
jgi:hypothetical protein